MLLWNRRSASTLKTISNVCFCFSAKKKKILAKKLTYPPPPPLRPNTQEALRQTSHNEGFRSFMCEPDTLRKPEGVSQSSVSVLPCLFFHRNIWKLIYESTPAKNRIQTCRLLTQCAVEVGMVWRFKFSVMLRRIVLWNVAAFWSWPSSETSVTLPPHTV